MKPPIPTGHLVFAGVAAATLLSSLAIAAPPPANKSQAEAHYRSEIAPFLKKHCTECHGPDAQEGEIRFDTFPTAAAVAADEKTWHRAIQMLRSGAMPPDDSPQPTEAERRRRELA
jgi:mono/diheme cytochrome c family protein